MSQQFIAELAKRRSIYALGKNLPKPKPEISQIIKDAARICPSSFNVESSRLVILYGAEHDKLWQIVKDAIKAHVKDPAAYKASEAKIDGCFAAGAGTVLFYEDGAAIKGQQEQFPAYAHMFHTFSQHSSAMAQLAVWTALAQEGIGATLQHYNELIVTAVQKEYQVPESWQLIAQMPFGSIAKPADKRDFIPDEGRFVVRGE